MTTAGKVFSVLSFLLGIGFLYLMTPVAKSLIDTQKQIVEIEKRHPPLQEATVKLDKDRVQLTYDLNRLKDKVSSEQTKFKNQADVVRSQLSLLTDMEKAERAAVLSWQDTVKGITSEIEARTTEKSELETRIAEVTQQREERHQQVEQLREALAAAGRKLREIMAENLTNYGKLEQSTPAPTESSTASVVAEQE